jgi:hypothetical protein
MFVNILFQRFHFRTSTTQGEIMQANVGSIDRIIRIVVGLGLIVATLAGAIGPWGWIGVAPLLTGIFSRCPAYLPFGLSSCSKLK